MKEGNWYIPSAIVIVLITFLLAPKCNQIRYKEAPNSWLILKQTNIVHANYGYTDSSGYLHIKAGFTNLQDCINEMETEKKLSRNPPKPLKQKQTSIWEVIK
jgi:hypothetical protein